MQNESPVAYASTGYQKQKQDMCKSRERERERVTGHSVGCSHFKAYLYGQDIVYVKTDHKPLKAIVLVTQQCTQVFTKNVITTAKIQSRSKVQEETIDIHGRHINCLK